MKNIEFEVSQTLYQPVIVRTEDASDESIAAAGEAVRAAIASGEVNLPGGWPGSEASEPTVTKVYVGEANPVIDVQEVTPGKKPVFIQYRRDDYVAVTEEEARALIEFARIPADYFKHPHEVNKPSEDVKRILERFHDGYIPGPCLGYVAKELGLSSERIGDIET